MQRSTRLLRNKSIQAPPGWTAEELSRIWRRTPSQGIGTPPTPVTFDLKTVAFLTLSVVFITVAVGLIIHEYRHGQEIMFQRE